MHYYNQSAILPHPNSRYSDWGYNFLNGMIILYHTMKNFLTMRLAVLLLLSMLACDSGQSQDSQELFDRLSQKVTQLGDAIHDKKQPIESMASDELEKLFTFEYKVVELPIDDSRDAIEAQLSALGQNRWECFHIEEKQEIIRLFCKRRPKTYLRLIPRVF